MFHSNYNRLFGVVALAMSAYFLDKFYALVMRTKRVENAFFRLCGNGVHISFDGVDVVGSSTHAHHSIGCVTYLVDTDQHVVNNCLPCCCPVRYLKICLPWINKEWHPIALFAESRDMASSSTALLEPYHDEDQLLEDVTWNKAGQQHLCSLVVGSVGDWSGALHNSITQHGSGCRHMWVQGPFAPNFSTFTHDLHKTKVLVVANGVSITAPLSMIEQGSIEGKQILCVWNTRDLEMVEHFLPKLGSISGAVAFFVFYTGAHHEGKRIHAIQKATSAPNVSIYFKRCDIPRFLLSVMHMQEALSERVHGSQSESFQRAKAATSSGPAGKHTSELDATFDARVSRAQSFSSSLGVEPNHPSLSNPSPSQSRRLQRLVSRSPQGRKDSPMLSRKQVMQILGVKTKASLEQLTKEWSMVYVGNNKSVRKTLLQLSNATHIEFHEDSLNDW